MKAKRKLSDLKENECIKVNTLKQQKLIFNKIFSYRNPVISSALNKDMPTYLCRNEVGFYWDICKLDHHIELPATDFIKPKKSKLSDLEKRVKSLEDKMTISEVIAKCVNVGASVNELKSPIKEEIKTTSDEIDWSKHGQLVKSGNSVIIMTTGTGSSVNYKSFSGVVLEGGRFFDKGYYSGTFSASEFKLIEGEININKP